MMDYAQECGGAKMQILDSRSVRKDTPLDRISEHANSAGRIGDLIEQFVDRFHNNPKCDGEATALNAVRVSHADQLERLERNLARAEELARSLQSIG